MRDDKDTNGNLAKAEANWPGRVESKGKSSVRQHPHTRPTSDDMMESLRNSSAVVGWICRLAAGFLLAQTLFFKFTGTAESVYILTKMALNRGVAALRAWRN
jgi:hypothetical protein